MGVTTPRRLYAASQTRFHLPGMGIITFDGDGTSAASFTIDAGGRKFVFARTETTDDS